MRRKILLLAFLILFSLVPSGCWDYEEYENLIQVSAIGVDYNKEAQETTLTIQYIPTKKAEKSSGSESSGSASKDIQIVHSATDKTLFDALTKLEQVINKKLFFGYMKVIVVGEDAAKYDMADIMELFDRTPIIRSSSNIVISPGKAEDSLSTFDPSLTESSSEEINDLVNISEQTGAAFPVSVNNFAQMLTISGIEATAPSVISVYNKPQTEAKGGTEDNIRYDQEREGDHKIVGIAAFKGGKLVGFLNYKESLGLGWIKGKKIISYKTSQISGQAEPKNILFFRLTDSGGKITVQMKNGKPAMKIDVSVNADLRKYYSNSGSEYLSPEVVSTMEKKLADSVRSDVEAALKKGQKELKSDIFGFGFAFFRKYPGLWHTEYEKKWQDIFPDIPVNLKVTAQVLNTDTNNKRLIIK